MLAAILLRDYDVLVTILCFSVGKRTTDLQYAVVQWHKWNTDCKELETHLVKTSFDIETVELGLCEQK